MWRGPRAKRFDEAALAAARKFVFEPARKDWEPIAARIRYRYIFELKAPAEEITTGWLSGAVLLAEDDSPAGAVAIEILNERNELVRDLVSGADGTFVATDLEPGKYQVDILGGEYGDLKVEEELVAGQVTQVIYRLGAKKKAAYSGFGATAVVDAPPREVVKRTIDKEELTRIPAREATPFARWSSFPASRARPSALDY